jgi:hypothetical protein
MSCRDLGRPGAGVLEGADDRGDLGREVPPDVGSRPTVACLGGRLSQGIVTRVDVGS